MMLFDKKMQYMWLGCVLLLLDRVSKYAVLQWLTAPVAITSFLDLTLAVNHGMSWGLFTTDRMLYVVLIRICIIALIALLCVYMASRYRHNKPIYAEIAILAGAMSNLWDRFSYGGVIDFIHLHYGHWSWPIFNIADMAIVSGVLWMILHADNNDT